MQFSTLAVIAAAATAVSAGYNGTVVYTTDIVTAYTTYCPEATSITLGASTYTVSEATTLTITDCPCTIVKPVTTSSVVICSTCSSAPVVPTSAPVYVNSTSVAATSTSAGAVGTSSVATSAGTSATASPSPITASSGNKAAALSGASLAGLVGFAAYFL